MDTDECDSGLFKEPHNCRIGHEETPFHKKPLYYWVKFFADKKYEAEENFSNFISSNVLNNALEYVGIANENEQSSLHLSAIFDEENHQQSRNRFPTHYESETKSRIQSLNRVFLELKSHFEDHFSQLVAIRPPNTVHIASSCQQCSVKEFEKILFLLLGASIQGGRKQDTIRKIKRFPSEIQDALIESIKLIADNPELVHIKSWLEFANLEENEKQLIYEANLTLIRRLLAERNESIQNQLVADYLAGYMNCSQKKVYEGKGYGPESEYDKFSDESRNILNIRMLKEELIEKTELLAECREELETSKTRVQELEIELNENLQQLRSWKKARDELDALREGHEKASRLEVEVTRMKKKLEESEQIYDKIDSLQKENRTLQLKHDILLDQMSFLSVDKQTKEDEDFDFESSFSRFSNGDSFNNTNNSDILLEIVESDDEINNVEKLEEIETSTKEKEDKEEELETNVSKECSPIPTTKEEGEKVEKSLIKRIKRQRRRSSVVNGKRTRKTSFTPQRVQKMMISPAEKDDANREKVKENRKQRYDINGNSSKQKSFNVRPKRSSLLNRRLQNIEKHLVPNLDIGNEADEELSSLSPNGDPNEESNEETNTTDELRLIINENDSELFFICDPMKSSISLLQKSEEGGRRVPLLQVTARNPESEPELNMSDCTIQVNLRQNPIQNNFVPPQMYRQTIEYVDEDETSSEDDDSVWYEYGCV